jgi:hypothetical protein
MQTLILEPSYLVDSALILHTNSLGCARKNTGEKKHRKRNAREAIFSSGGTKIANRQRYHISVKQATSEDDDNNDYSVIV